ncbi:unnamed protein product [Closterium sp. NIES-54]
MAFASAILANPITPLRLEADGTSSNFKAWSYRVDKLLLSREVGELDLKDVLLNHGKGKQPPIPKEPSDPTDVVATQEYEDSVAKYRKWEKAEAAIIGIFTSSNPPELVNTFHNYPTSNAIWKHLQDRFIRRWSGWPSSFLVSFKSALRIARVWPTTSPRCKPSMASSRSWVSSALLVGLTSAYEVTRKMLFTSSAEDLTFAKVSSALLSAEKDSSTQAKAYALRDPVPQACVASALASAPFQRNRFPPCAYILKYGNRKGQVCGGTNHPSPHASRRKTTNVEAQDPAQARASDIAPAYVRIYLLFPGTAMINEATSQYIGSSQASQYIDFTIDSGATHTVLKGTLSFKPYATPIPLLGVDSIFTTLAKGSSTVPCPAFPSGTVTGMCVPSLRHNLVAQKEIQEAGSRTIFSENEDYCDIIDPLTNKVLALFTLNSSGLYTLRVPIPQVSTTQAHAAITPCSCRSFSNPTILYHHRLGHPKFRTLADMASKKLLLGLPASLPPPPDSPAPTCLDCTKSKLHQHPHPASPSVAAAPLCQNWLTRDAAARLAIRNHLPLTECAHFGHHRTAQTLYDAVVARYSSHATAALGRLLLPDLFPELSTFATVEDLASHLRTSDARYHAALPAEFLAKNPPPMYITLYFIVTRLPNSLRAVRDHFLALDPTALTVDLLEQHLLALETSVVAVGAARGTPHTPFFEGCSPSPLAPSYASAAAVDVPGAEDVGVASASAKHRRSKGKGGRDGGGGSGGGGGGSGGVGSGGSGGGSGGFGGGGGGSSGSGGSGSGGGGGGRTGALRGGDRAGHTCGKLHTQHRCFSRLDDTWRAEFGNKAKRPRWAELLRYGVAIFDLDFDAILAAMYALFASAEGASEFVLPGAAHAEALHTFTLDSRASRCFFRDSTALTPLSAPVPVRLADPSGGPVLARSSTVLLCPAVPSGSLSGLHLPSFSTNLVSTTALQDAMVTTTTPGGQRVLICTYTRMGRHLATFTRRPGSSQVAPPCSCRLLSHQTLLWNHRQGHPSLPRLRGMHSRLLVSGLPRSLPPLPPSPTPPCLPCVEGQQRSAPHSSLFPPTAAPLQTLHMDRFSADLPVLRLHSDRGGEFLSELLRDFCRGEGILQLFMLPDSPQQNEIAERCIGLIMEVARTSMIHAAAPHFLWPFPVQYAAHQLNLWPRVSLPETSPTLRWTGKVDDASVFRVWGSRAFVRDTSADKLSTRAIPCVFLGFSPDAPGWHFYHPTSCRVLSSQDVTFDESVPFYHLFLYHSAPPPPPALFLAPGPPLVDPLPPQGLAPSGVSQVDPLPGTAPIEVAVGSGAASGDVASGGAEPGGAEFGGVGSEGAGSRGAEPEGAESEGAGSRGAEPGGVEPAGVAPGGAEPERVEPGGTESEGAESGGAKQRGTASSRGPTRAPPRLSPRLEPLSPQQLREWFAQRTRLRSGAAGAGISAAGDTGAGGAGDNAGAGGTGGSSAAGPGGAHTGGTGAAEAGGVGGAGAGDPTEPGAAGAGRAGAVGAGAGGTGAGGVRARGVGAVDPGARGSGGIVRPRPYFVPLLQQRASPLPSPSPYTEQTGGLTERREPVSRPASRAHTGRCVPRPHPPPVPTTHAMTVRPSSVPLRVSLVPPHESSLPALPDPESDRALAASPTVSRLLATVVTDPSFESSAASALVVELVDFAAACRLDYATALVAESAESESASPPSVGGECSLGNDLLEDRQEEFECLVAAVPRFSSMLLAPEGDPNAPDIPTPRSYTEAITGPYSSQWQAAMDAEMASWNSTDTYVDAVPLSRANIVDGMWIFKVKRPPGSPPAFKAHYVARGFTFLQGSLHEEIWLRHPPGFRGSFPASTHWNLRRPVYSLRQAPREWHDTLRTTLVALGFTPSTADPSLFLRTDMSLPPFYVLVYVNDLVFATADTETLTLVKSELHKRHTFTDLGELRSYLGLQITRDRAPATITLTQSHMMHQVLQRFGFQFSSPQPNPLSTSHLLLAPHSDESVEPSGPYPELVGCLIYLMTCIRPDLAYPLSLLARYMAPGRHRKVHWDAAKRVLRYLCSTSRMGLVLGGRGPIVLTGHADASWVDDSATQRSSQGYTFSLGSGSVSWRSTRSSSVLSSSCEAEIYAGAMAAQELHWLTFLLTDLGEHPRSPRVMYVDNKAMIALCQEHRLEHRTKLITLRYFLARVAAAWPALSCVRGH